MFPTSLFLRHFLHKKKLGNLIFPSFFLESLKCINITVDITFTHTTRNQLIVLSAKVKNDYCLFIQSSFLLQLISIFSYYIGGFPYLQGAISQIRIFLFLVQCTKQLSGVNSNHPTDYHCAPKQPCHIVFQLFKQNTIHCLSQWLCNHTDAHDK